MGKEGRARTKGSRMIFDAEKYETRTVTCFGTTVTFRAYENVPYVEKPASSRVHRMNIYIPEGYYHNETINGYTGETAPVYFQNAVGAYMEGRMEQPGLHKPFGQTEEEPNNLFKVLSRGYIGVSALIRGRQTRDDEGKLIGKAPALIVDYKAAIRFLRHIGGSLPGDYRKIITNGTSAGGALSAMAGSMGNHPDFEPYLQEIGACEGDDTPFAASCYCPIINLENADMAYEWEFCGVNEYFGIKRRRLPNGRDERTPITGELSDFEKEMSRELADLFPAYVNGLRLVGPDGENLTLNPDGTGSFRDYVESLVIDSANREIAHPTAAEYAGRFGKTEAPEDKSWLTMENGKAVSMDFAGWAKEITRLKTPPAFDGMDLTTPENDEFGLLNGEEVHFTDYAYEKSGRAGTPADKHQVKLINPMNYVDDPKAKKTMHWRIRHGERDRDTSLAVSAIFVLKLREQGITVDYSAPWEQPHSGDYDMEELFAWIDRLCRP